MHLISIDSAEMRATFNSRPSGTVLSRYGARPGVEPRTARQSFVRGFGRFLVGVLGAWWALSVMPHPAGLWAAESPFVQRAEKAYQVARASHHAEPTNDELAWRFARACFYRADYTTSNSQRAALAEEGIAVCRQIIKRRPKLAVGHYYLALNLGQLARPKTLGALSIVDKMETELKAAIALDPKLDYAGPDLSLGILYRDAPGWPASIGNRSKAREHLRQAVKRSPDYPENRLILLESYLEWNDKQAFQQEFEEAVKPMAAACKLFTGEEWEENWADWGPRWEKLKSKAPPPPASQ